MLEICFTAAISTSVCAILRGRSAVAWFIIGGTLPVVGLILLYLLPEVGPRH